MANILKIGEAVSLLRSGGIAAYPTETFYGLGVDPANFAAVSSLMQLKDRSEGAGVLLLIDQAKRLFEWSKPLEEEGARMLEELIAEFWPGPGTKGEPLTLVTDVDEKTGKRFSPLLFGPGKSLAVRFSSDSTAGSLAEALGGGITSTSANPPGEPPSATVEEVLAYYPQLAVVDRIEPAEVLEQQGLPSTILDVRTFPFQVLREGVVSREKLSAYL